MKFQRSKKGHGFLFFIAALVLILLAVLFFLLRPDGDPVPQGGSSVNLEDSSGASSESGSSEETPSSEEGESSDDVQSSEESSQPPASSSPSSSDIPSSAPTPSSEPEQPTGGGPEGEVNTEDGTITMNGVVYNISDLPAGNLSDWNLILLNPEDNNKIDAELDINLVQIDSQYVDERAAVYFNQMKAAAAQSNITLFLRSGYRSMSTQRVNYNNSVANYKAQGYSEAEAIRLTNQYYTVPGHSEHHSGLAFDTITPEYHNNIYQLDDRFADTEAYTWLRANCADYGFILRYPKEKESVTRINFEPWHYRYVGVEHAKFITAYNLCLEEYIQLLKLAGR